MSVLRSIGVRLVLIFAETLLFNTYIFPFSIIKLTQKASLQQRLENGKNYRERRETPPHQARCSGAPRARYYLYHPEHLVTRASQHTRRGRDRTAGDSFVERCSKLLSCAA